MWAAIKSKIETQKSITLKFWKIGSNAEPQTLAYIGRHSH